MTFESLKSRENDEIMRGEASHFSIVPGTILALMLGVVLSACSFSLAEDVTPPPGYQPPPVREPAPTVQSVSLPDEAPDLVNGSAIYAEKCAACHGPVGLGNGEQAAQLPQGAPAIGSPDLARAASPAEWFRVVTEGRLENFMPPFVGSLNDQDRWDVVAYAFSLSLDAAAVEQGRELYELNCSSCHGQTGAGDGPDATSQALLLTDLSSPSAMADKTDLDLMAAITSGVSPGMPAFGSELSDGERWALAAFVRTMSAGGPAVEQAIAEVETAAEDSAPVAEENAEDSENRTSSAEVSDIHIGSIGGWVINGSGGELPAGLEATLHAFDHIEEIYTRTIEVAQDGSYEFDEVEMPVSRIFMVTVDHGGLTYNSDLAIMEADSDTANLTLPVTVFETTTDASMLVIDRLHIFVESTSPGVLQVTELYLITNPDDRVVVASEEGQPVVTYELPEGATNLRFEPSFSQDRFAPLPNGFGDLAGIPPGTGQHQVMYAYDVAFDRKLDLEQRLELPVNSVIFLMPEMGIRVRSDQLQDRGAREIQGEKFRVYSSGRMDAGSSLKISLSGNVNSDSLGTAGIGANTGMLIGAVVLVASVGLTGVWLFRNSDRFTNRQTDPAPEVPANEGKEDLLDAIIALDALYTSGELPEEAYRARRAELKSRLAEKLKAE